ncbi:hypothetical protein H4582DRAFT_2060694 [Lactarius indigo]|nr:hypothetical protein H4582DRAFT_2060694 [Lactarius indigo]
MDTHNSIDIKCVLRTFFLSLRASLRFLYLKVSLGTGSEQILMTYGLVIADDRVFLLFNSRKGAQTCEGHVLDRLLSPSYSWPQRSDISVTSSPTRLIYVNSLLSHFFRRRGTLALLLACVSVVFTVYTVTWRFGTEGKLWPATLFTGEPLTIVFSGEKTCGKDGSQRFKRPVLQPPGATINETVETIRITIPTDAGVDDENDHDGSGDEDDHDATGAGDGNGDEGGRKGDGDGDDIM